MKRQLWFSSISETYCPPWTCPTCKAGTLRLRQKSLIYCETIESLRWHDQEGWGPEHLEFTFSAWLDCSNDKCKEKLAVTGTGGIEQEYTGDDEGSTDWVSHFYPRWIEPPLRIIETPARCPAVVSNALRDAFALYWSQPEACAGRIRVALEALLTHLGVPESEVQGSGKSIPLKLHRRIELFTKQNEMIGTQLMALKWLGNTGSHGSEVTRGDIIDGLELLEHSLVEVLDKRSEKMTILAKKLTDRHGPKAP